MARRLISCAASFVCLTALCEVRRIAAANPHFEVASIRINSAGGPRFGVIQRSPDTLTMRAVSLWMSIRWAYDLESFGISGPDWLQTAPLYDIVAKAPGPTTESDMRLMLRSLLAERFHLVTHHQQSEVPVNALVVAKGGPKLHSNGGKYNPAAGAEMPLQFLGFDDKAHVQVNIDSTGRRRETFTSAPIALLASVLAMLSSRTPYDKVAVVDMTGLKGTFDFVLVHDPAGPGDRVEGSHPTSNDVLADYKPVLEKELGLTIAPRRIATDILVVDRAEKNPTSN